jgi:hypothetical protein
MKNPRAAIGLIGAAFLLAGSCALAQFSGYFNGYYAPGNWASSVYGNALYQNTAYVYIGGAPGSLEIDGAVDAQQQISQPQPPVSVIDYTIVLSGSGLQPVAFKYGFTGKADGYDAAALIYDSGSGLQVVTSLSTLLNGVQQSYSGSFQAGHAFGFRVYSNNDNVADRLVISPIPEPSTFTLAALGAGAFLLRAIRRRNS